MPDWHAYLEGQPWARGCLDESSYRAFLRAVSLDVPEPEALAAVAARIRAAGDRPRPGKLRDQLDRARAFIGANGPFSGASRHAPEAQRGPRSGWADLEPLQRTPVPGLDARLITTLARMIPLEVTPEWLRARSPVWAAHPAEFLDRLYRPDECVVVLPDARSLGWVRRHYHTAGDSTWRHFTERAYCEEGGTYFMIQPVDGHLHFNPRTRAQSVRSEEAVTSWRYACLESDSVDSATWLKVLVQLPLPICAIYSSGRRSIHGLVFVGAGSKPEWDHEVRGSLLPKAARLGADPQALTGVRLSRLPFCPRGSHGNAMQTLLYLNPATDGTPIMELPHASL